MWRRRRLEAGAADVEQGRGEEEAAEQEGGGEGWSAERVRARLLHPDLLVAFNSGM